MGKKKSKVKKKGKKALNKNMKKSGYKKKKKVNPTVSKKMLKDLGKVLEKNHEIPELKKVRKKCNHQLKKTTAFVAAAEFDKDQRYLVKNLDAMVELFGEENVGICTNCLTAVPSIDVLSPDDVDRCVQILAGAAEHVVSNTSSEKEIDKVHDSLKDAAELIRAVSKKYRKVFEKNYDGETKSTGTVATPKSGIDYSKIGQ